MDTDLAQQRRIRGCDGVDPARPDARAIRPTRLQTQRVPIGNALQFRGCPVSQFLDHGRRQAKQQRGARRIATRQVPDQRQHRLGERAQTRAGRSRGAIGERHRARRFVTHRAPPLDVIEVQRDQQVGDRRESPARRLIETEQCVADFAEQRKASRQRTGSQHRDHHLQRLGIQIGERLAGRGGERIAVGQRQHRQLLRWPCKNTNRLCRTVRMRAEDRVSDFLGRRRRSCESREDS